MQPLQSTDSSVDQHFSISVGLAAGRTGAGPHPCWSTDIMVVPLLLSHSYCMHQGWSLWATLSSSTTLRTAHSKSPTPPSTGVWRFYKVLRQCWSGGSRRLWLLLCWRGQRRLGMAPSEEMTSSALNKSVKSFNEWKKSSKKSSLLVELLQVCDWVETLCFPGQRCFVHFTKANALFRQSHQGLAASVEVNTCLERAKGGVSQFAEFCGLLLFPGTQMVWTVHAWSRCQVRLSPPAAASLGSGELRFGAARSSPWSWGTLCAPSLLAVVPTTDVGWAYQSIALLRGARLVLGWRVGRVTHSMAWSWTFTSSPLLMQGGREAVGRLGTQHSPRFHGWDPAWSFCRACSPSLGAPGKVTLAEELGWAGPALGFAPLLVRCSRPRQEDTLLPCLPAWLLRSCPGSFYSSERSALSFCAVWEAKRAGRSRGSK